MSEGLLGGLGRRRRNGGTSSRPGAPLRPHCPSPLGGDPHSLKDKVSQEVASLPGPAPQP